MIRYSFILVGIGFLISHVAQGADRAVCRISESSYEEFQHLVGAEISLDLKTGYNEITLNGKKTSLINEDSVSSHKVHAKHCKPTQVEETKDESGLAETIQFGFDCAPAVFAVEGINLKSKSGVYFELLVSDTPRAPRFSFDSCVIQ